MHGPRRIVSEEQPASFAAALKSDAPARSTTRYGQRRRLRSSCLLRNQDRLPRIIRARDGCCSPKTLKYYQLRRGGETAV
jgi:hypothetical protein